MGKKAKETVGLDIGSYAIKAASVLKKPDKNILTAYNVKRVTAGGEKPADPGKLVEETLNEVDIHPGDVNLSISGSNVIVRFIDLPKMSRDQLENAMTFEAEKYIPFNVNEVIMDFLILDDSGEGQMNVLLAAAKKDFVQSQIELLEKLGINVNVIDINAFAVFNAVSSFNTIAGEKGTAFLDLGHLQTNVLVSTGAIPRFMRLIQIGGKDITNMIAEDIGVSPEEAEEIKLKPEGEINEKVTRFTSTVLDELVKEVQLSFGYFESKHNKTVGDIYCSGGMVYQEGAVEYIQEKLGTELKVWNPVGPMEIAESLSRDAINPIASQLTVSIGLALRG